MAVSFACFVVGGMVGRVVGDREARLGYRAWLYVQVSSGDMITRDMLSWRDEIEVP